MLEPNSTPSPQNLHPRWERSDTTAGVINFEAAKKTGVSQRSFAIEHDIPRTTLQYWVSRKDGIDADPALIGFFESPVGVAFLNRLVIAADFIFREKGSCGIRFIKDFLELSGLDRFVASSVGALQRLSTKVEKGICEFGKIETERLAPGMLLKQITLCEDETFHPAICLVAIDPVSGFILVEKYAEKRDADTWNKAIRKAIKGLNVEVIQSTSDEASGILCHVREELGAHHSPDLFHGQRELHKATSLPLHSHVSQGSHKVEDAEKRVLEAKAEFQNYRENPPRGGFPPDFPKRITSAEQAAQEERLKLEEAKRRREQMGEAIRGISDDYHPYDLNSGAKIEAQDVEKRIKERFEEIDRVAEEAQLSEGSLDMIDKARRLIVKFVATIAFYHLMVEMWVKDLMLSAEIEHVVLKELIPALYLQRVAKKQKTVEKANRIKVVYEPLLAKIRGPDSVLSKLTAEERAKVEQVAEQSADLFQRSSSCVEGRNGQLSLRHHSLHRLSDRKLEASTVVHNFYLKRCDGTTSAERFFGAKPRDLFEWLLDHIGEPARPAKKRSKTVHKDA